MSFKIYPRIDLDYQKKRSLDFDILHSEIYDNRDSGSNEGWRWVAFMLIGVFTGIVAFAMSSLEEFLVDLRITTSEMALEWSENN